MKQVGKPALRFIMSTAIWALVASVAIAYIAALRGPGNERLYKHSMRRGDTGWWTSTQRRFGYVLYRWGRYAPELVINGERLSEGGQAILENAGVREGNDPSALPNEDWTKLPYWWSSQADFFHQYGFEQSPQWGFDIAVGFPLPMLTCHTKYTSGWGTYEHQVAGGFYIGDSKDANGVETPRALPMTIVPLGLACDWAVMFAIIAPLRLILRRR